MGPRLKRRPQESPPPPPPSPEKPAAAAMRQLSAANSPPAEPPGAAPSLLHEPAAARLRAAAAADAAAPRADFLWAPPRWLHRPLASLLEDPRDLPILFLLLNVLLTTVPAAVALFALFPPATRPLPHWLGAAYLLASFAAYLARFMLSLHYSQHRRLFRKGEPGGAGAGAGDAGGGLCSLRFLFAEALACMPVACQGLSADFRAHPLSGCAQACGPSTWWAPCSWRRCSACRRVRTRAAHVEEGSARGEHSVMPSCPAQPGASFLHSRPLLRCPSQAAPADRLPHPTPPHPTTTAAATAAATHARTQACTTSTTA